MLTIPVSLVVWWLTLGLIYSFLDFWQHRNHKEPAFLKLFYLVNLTVFWPYMVQRFLLQMYIKSKYKDQAVANANQLKKVLKQIQDEYDQKVIEDYEAGRNIPKDKLN